MADLQVLDAAGLPKYLKAGAGVGSSADPFVSTTAARVGATSDAAATSDAGTFSLIALIKRLLGKFAANEGHIGEVGGLGVRVSSELIRPNDVAAYAVGDVVANATAGAVPVTLANVARKNGGSGEITSVRVWTDKKSIVPRLRVHFYNAAPTVVNDNAPWVDKYADVGKYIGSVLLPAMTTGADAINSDVSRAEETLARLPFVAGAGTRDLYAVVEVVDAFTPNLLQKFTLSVGATLD